MTPAMLDLVTDLPACAYCVPFMDARLQRRFIDAFARAGLPHGRCHLRQGGATRDRARTRHAATRRPVVLQRRRGGTAVPRRRRADVRPAAVHHRGAAGVTVYQGDHRTEVDGQRVDAVDPTGAGDTFCGTTVARLLLGDHPVEAARRGNAAAAEMVTGVGPATLWQRGAPPLPIADPRVSVDHDAVGRMAGLIAGLTDLQAFDFTGDLFPDVGDAARPSGSPLRRSSSTASGTSAPGCGPAR